MGLAPPTVTAPSAFYNVGVADLRAATLTAEDYANAYNSLLAIDPASSPTNQAAFAGQFTTDLAYFTIDAAGAPQLVIPANSPSFGATAGPTSTTPAPSATLPPGFTALPTAATPPPAGGALVAAPTAPTAPAGSITVPAGALCPSGFVSSGADLTGMVSQAFTLLPPGAMTQTTETIPGACKPMPVVACVGDFITADDFLRVSVFTSVTTTGLTLNARILDCDSVMHYLSNSLDGLPLSTWKTFVIPLTTGYLLSVSVSDLGSSLTSGQTFVSIGFQHSSQTGSTPVDVMAQGYVTGLYSVAWPATVTGAPTTPTPTPSGGVAFIQARAGGVDSGATVAVTLPNNVTGGNCLVAFTEMDTISDPVTMSDNQSNTWTKIIRDPSTRYEIWAARNVNSGTTTVTYAMTPPHNFSLQMQVMEFSGIDLTSPGDVSASNYSVSPLTATTPATTHADIGVVSYSGLVTGVASSGVPVGWQVILDSQTTDTRRIISLWNPNKTSPPTTWSFTGYLNFSACAVLIAAMHVAGG